MPEPMPRVGHNRRAQKAMTICRLEDADYEEHSLAMLNRIAAALHRRVEIRFVPLRGAKHSGAHGALRA